MSKKKIEFAPADKVEELRSEVDELLRQLAPLFKEPGESDEDWVKYVFVSDESSLGDFLSSESELVNLRERLEIPELEMRSSICAVALTLSEKKAPQTIH